MDRRATARGTDGSGPVPRLRVGFILAPRFTLCAFANFVDVLRLAADDGDRSRPILCRWSVLSDVMEAVTSSCGVAIQPNERLPDPTGFDYIVVVGGLIAGVPNLGPDLAQYLRRAAVAQVPLVGVCTGAFVLHRVGLMDGYRCCVSWFHHADFLDQSDGMVPVSDQIFIVDRDRLTCSGGVSSAHLAARLVEKHVGKGAARKSLQIMMIDEALEAEQPQPGIALDLTTTDGIVRKALLWMQQNTETPVTIEEVARHVGTPRRSLERRFQAALGCSPGASYLSMRLNQATLLLNSTTQSVVAVAMATGFCDASHLARILKRERGMTPTRLRQDPKR